MSFARDERGAVEAVGTIFALSITFLFVGVVGTVGLSPVLDASAGGASQKMATVGATVQGTIQETDQRVRTSDSTGEIGIHLALGTHIGNGAYTISITAENDQQYVVIEVPARDLTRRVAFASETPVENTTVEGGDVYVVRPAGTDKIHLESEDAE